MGKKAWWFGDHLGLCDNYKKKIEKQNNGGSNVPAGSNV
jgi:hypothetical protein